MAVTVATDLQRDVIMGSALTAMKTRLLSLRAFAHTFESVPLEGTDKVVVPFYPLETSASKNFNGTYDFGDSYETETRDVTINRRKYQPISLTSKTASRQPAVNLEQVGEQKGYKLASDVMQDILSVITAANYGGAILTDVAANFDFAALNETVGLGLDNADWPKEGRSAVVKPAYYRNLVGELTDASAYGSNDPVRRGMLQDVAGFDLFDNNSIPANGESLTGFVTLQSAVLVGFAPITPIDPKNIVDYYTMTDEETKLTLEWRTWFDPFKDTLHTVIECNYGYEVGQEEALKRIVSA